MSDPPPNVAPGPAVAADGVDPWPAPERPRTPPGPHLSGLWFVTGPVLLVLVGTLIVAAATRVPYFALSPGSARSVEPLISFDGAGA